jgi:hypothetical protein
VAAGHLQREIEFANFTAAMRTRVPDAAPVKLKINRVNLQFVSTIDYVLVGKLSGYPEFFSTRVRNATLDG